MQEIIFTDTLTPTAYNELRESVGWARITDNQAKRGLKNTTFLVAAKHNNNFVGMGRVIFDYGYTAYIGDVIVEPNYQRKGIGKTIVSILIDKVKDASDKGDKIMFILGAAKGKESFYEKLGFDARPSSKYGAGMCKYEIVE